MYKCGQWYSSLTNKLSPIDIMQLEATKRPFESKYLNEGI